MSTLEPGPVGASATAPGGATASGPPPSIETETGSASSIGTIISQLTADFSTLMKQEVALAKAEVTTSAKEAGLGAGLYGGAGVAIHFAALFVSLALWVWVGNAIGYGWSALIGAIVWAIIGAVLAARAKRSLSKVTGMEKTAETVGQIPDALKGKDHQK